jgi:hypothetical protein
MTRIGAGAPRPQDTSPDGQHHFIQVATNLFRNEPKPGETHVQIDLGDFAKKKNFQGCSPVLREKQLEMKASMLKALSRHPPDSIFGKLCVARQQEFKTMLAWHEEALAKPIEPEIPEKHQGVTQVGTHRFEYRGPNGTLAMLRPGKSPGK